MRPAVRGRGHFLSHAILGAFRWCSRHAAALLSPSYVAFFPSAKWGLHKAQGRHIEKEAFPVLAPLTQRKNGKGSLPGLALWQ